MSEARAAVLDTDVFSLLFVRLDSRDSRVPGWRILLKGRQVLVSFQTRAELLAGARISGWGESRVARLRGILGRTPTIGADDDVIEACATLQAECRRDGHALQDKIHTGDRWIAASAIAKGVPLLAGDGVYANAPGLELLEVTND